MDYIIERLKKQQDTAYRQFQRKLLPTVEPSRILGVRTPALRSLAETLRKEPGCSAFLAELPHTFFEENQLHGFLISGMTDFQSCIEELERFLPYMDNWATCDQTSPKLFRQHKEELLPYIMKWLESEHTYTLRFAVGMLMQHFLDADFKEAYLAKVAAIRSEEYYVNMELAWYMATALAKQWDCAVVYIQEQKLDPWVHNRTIQKARESYRITDKQKDYLKQFVRKKQRP